MDGIKGVIAGVGESIGIPNSKSLPLEGLVVLEIASGRSGMCARYLADLGAEVILIEPPGGISTRQRAPIIAGTSLYFATHHANKRSVVLDPTDPDDQARLRRLLANADVLIDDGPAGQLEDLNLDSEALADEFPALVVCSISEFGQFGPYRNYVATGAVHLALGGVLCRSGRPGAAPLLPPTELAYETAAIQAAWYICVAYWKRLSTGSGDRLDFSVFEAVAQVLDPGLGVTGSARAGASALDMSRDRPDASFLYPIYPCLDGHVRVCVLSVRQWAGMRGWLGSPEALCDPAFESTAYRLTSAAAAVIDPFVIARFGSMTADALVEEGQSRGVPIARVNKLRDTLSDEHFTARGTFVDILSTPEEAVKAPFGYVEIDQAQAGIRRPAPTLGEYDDRLERHLAPAMGVTPRSPGRDQSPPLKGIRVLDLGIIVVGAELGRLFADQGAEVIKVENKTYPDGSRQSAGGELMTASFASGHRGKLSLGLDLRSGEGKEIFLALVQVSDVILSNFKPGTLESLGITYEDLVKVNPRIIMSDSSALGSHGPKSRRMGYGPLVRAETGLTRMWSYPNEAGEYWDGITIFPDHFAARVGAVAVIACLIRRCRTGRGGTTSVSQAETIFTTLSERIAWASVGGTESTRIGDSLQDAVVQCGGDDEWCVVSIRSEADRQALEIVLAGHEVGSGDSSETKAAHDESLVRRLRGWSRERQKNEVMATLQAQGVPAGMMLRLTEYASNPQMVERRFMRMSSQPGLDYPLPGENAPCLSNNLPDPDLRPAPFFGEHTVEIARQLLCLPDEKVTALLESEVLQDGPILEGCLAQDTAERSLISVNEGTAR